MSIMSLNKVHKVMLEKIRELAIQAGWELTETPEQHGLNEYMTSETGGIEIEFDYGSPMRMLTSIGSYVILGSCICGDNKKFKTLFDNTFATTVVRPQRDDDKTPYLEYQLNHSGPTIRIIRMRQGWEQ